MVQALRVKLRDKADLSYCLEKDFNICNRLKPIFLLKPFGLIINSFYAKKLLKWPQRFQN
jgi:hypothetical protein